MANHGVMVSLHSVVVFPLRAEVAVDGDLSTLVQRLCVVADEATDGTMVSWY
jgi:hypothetical protein